MRFEPSPRRSALIDVPGSQSGTAGSQLAANRPGKRIGRSRSPERARRLGWAVKDSNLDPLIENPRPQPSTRSRWGWGRRGDGTMIRDWRRTSGRWRARRRHARGGDAALQLIPGFEISRVSPAGRSSRSGAICDRSPVGSGSWRPNPAKTGRRAGGRRQVGASSGPLGGAESLRPSGPSLPRSVFSAPGRTSSAKRMRHSTPSVSSRSSTRCRPHEPSAALSSPARLRAVTRAERDWPWRLYSACFP